MTNEDIKKLKSKFVRRPTFVNNYNWYFESIIPHIVLDVYKNNDIDMYGKSGNSNIEEFKIKLLFKGDVVRNNNFLNINNKHNYYSLFNNICKGLRKYEILRTDDLEKNLSKFFEMHNLDCSNYKYWEQCMIAEILINHFIIKRFIINYGWVDVFKDNTSFYNKYRDRILNRCLNNLNKFTYDEIYNKIIEDKILEIIDKHLMLDKIRKLI